MPADLPEPSGAPPRPDRLPAVGRSALEDLRERLARLPPGHPSAAGYRRPAADRLMPQSQPSLPNAGAGADRSPSGDRADGSGPGARGSGDVDRERLRERGGQPGRPGTRDEADLLRRRDRPGGAGHQATAGKPETGRRVELRGHLGEQEAYRPWFADPDAPWFGADLADPWGQGPFSAGPRGRSG